MYEVNTPYFEGPLEVLLRLIEQRELEITQVSLAEVTGDFMAHVEQLRQEAEIEVVADFLAVAAKLLWIKSRALLPKPPKTLTDVEEEDVGDALVEQLRAYRRYKEAAQWLRERDAAGLRAYVHIGPAPKPQQVTLDLSGVTLAKLRAVAQRVLYPSDGPRPEDAIQRPRISIVQQIRLVRERLQTWAKTTYRRLLSPKPTRLEAVVTLQAVLELIKQRTVEAHQTQLFGEIVIARRVPPEELAEASTATTGATAP
jgi:segregation and condensation protein A